MSWVRVTSCIGLLCVALLGLNACTTPVSALDTLTQAEPDGTRQRALLRLNLASAYFEQGQTDVAQQEVRAALQIDPQLPQAYGLLGLIHQRDNAPDLAQQSFEQALQWATQAPVQGAELAAIQHNYGWFLCQQNRFVQAQAQFDSALSQAGYRQTEKTNRAMAFCQARALVNTPARAQQ